MKKRKIGIIASAVATCAVCGSMIAGATYALFTSEDTVNIAVTSGRVDVAASVEIASTTSMGVKQELGAWANGGFASVDGAAVTLANITPGDEVELNVSIANNSSVDTKYRVTYSVNKGYLLASGLDVAIDGAALADENGAYKTYATAWADLGNSVDPIAVTIAMGEEKDNLYQDLTAEISIGVEAVQANAGIAGAPEYTYFPDYSDVKKEDMVVLNSDADLQNALGAESAGKYIVLSDGCNTVLNSAVRNLDNVTIDADGLEITANEKGLAHLTGTNVTVKNAVFNKGSNNPWGVYSAGVSYYNCVFNNFSPYIDSSADITVDGCTFNNTTLQFCFNEGTNVLPENLVITNNVFNVNNTDANAHAIVFGGGEVEQWVGDAKKLPEGVALKNIVIENNTFNPVYKNASYVAYYIYTNKVTPIEGKVRTFFNNTFNGLARYSVNAIDNQYGLPSADVKFDLADAESAKYILCADCYNGYVTPHSEHSINNDFVIENGVATANNPGAWYAVENTDWATKKYVASYTVDVTEMTEGDTITFDFGEDKRWFGLVSGVQKTAEGSIAGACSSGGVMSNKAGETVEAGNVVEIEYVAYVTENGLVFELSVNGETVAIKTTANAYGNLYWDIYLCKYSEGANAAKLSNMHFDAIAK